MIITLEVKVRWVAFKYQSKQIRQKPKLFFLYHKDGTNYR